MVIKARFKDGVAVPETSVDVPDGTLVGIDIPEPNSPTTVEVPAELKEEFEFWENVNAASWEKFLEWEREAV